jgi:hypothetical protein
MIYHPKKEYNQLINVFGQAVVSCLEKVKSSWYKFNPDQPLQAVDKLFEDTLINSYEVLLQIVVKFINYEIVGQLEEFIPIKSEQFKTQCKEQLENFMNDKHDSESEKEVEDFCQKQQNFVIAEEPEEELETPNESLSRMSEVESASQVHVSSSKIF